MVAVPAAKPRPADAVFDVANAVERLVDARIALARTQLTRVSRSLVMAIVAAFGWVLMSLALVTVLARTMGGPAALFVVGGFHLVVGGVAMFVIRRGKG